MADLHGSDVTEQKLSNLSKSSLLAVASKPVGSPVSRAGAGQPE